MSWWCPGPGRWLTYNGRYQCERGWGDSRGWTLILRVDFDRYDVLGTWPTLRQARAEAELHNEKEEANV